MKDIDSEPLKKNLEQWMPEIEKDPELPFHVLNRIASLRVDEAKPEFTYRPMLLWGSIGAAAALVLVWLAGPRQVEPTSQNALSYALMIDPVSRLSVQDPPNSSGSIIDQLAWMKDRLDLSRDQFLQLVELHESYNNEFEVFYSELIKLDKAYSSYEQHRLNHQPVDFIALYELLEERKETMGRSSELTRELVSRVQMLLNPVQKQTYLSLFITSPQPGDA